MIAFLLGNLWRTAFLSAVLVIGVQTWRVDAAQRATADIQADWDAATYAATQDALKAEQDARKAEQAHADTLAAIDAQHQQELTNAALEAKRVRAELESGTRRVRAHWESCLATADRAGEVVDALGQPDAGAELRREDIEQILRIAGEADAQVRGLQAVIRADRALVK